MPIYARYSGVGSGAGGIQSINNSTIPAQQIVGGTAISVSTDIGTGITTITNTAPTVTTGNLTGDTNAKISISGGTNAVLGTGTSISQDAASATSNGYLTSTDWSAFNGKQNALTFGNLTSTDISVTGGNGAVIGTGTTLSINKGNLTGDTNANITISSGNGAVLGTGTSISQSAASSTANGYLSSTDWSTFDGKANATLNNLGVTAINASLLFNPDNTYDIGAAGASRPANIYAGTAVVTQLVHARDNVTGSGQHDITVRGGNGTTGNKDGGVLTLAGGQKSGTGVDGYIALITDASERMRILGTGNVGIGTTTPGHLLEVAGDAKVNSALLTGSTSGTITLSAANTTTSYTVKMPSAQGAAYSVLQNDGSGNLSWSVNTPSQTGNSGKFLVTNGTSTSWDTVVNNAQSASLDFRVAGGTDANLIFSKASTDRVGIGNNAPTAKLDVTGNIIASTDIQSASQNGGQLAGTRNRIINGAMQIDQRNAGASVTITSAVQQYTLDRWDATEDSDATITVQQVTDAPTGFPFSLKVTVTTADASIGATQYAIVRQPIEGFNSSDLNFGTANALTVAVSFWVKSSVTGTFGGVLQNSAFNRSYAFQYTINSANTWEKKSVSIAGDTTGTWIGATNGVGIRVGFSLGAGSTYSGTANTWTGSYIQQATGNVNLISTLNATWQITGVQLEIGTVATSFEWRNYQQELAMCERYYLRDDGTYYIPSGVSGEGYIMYNFKSTMRATPTLTYTLTNTTADNLSFTPYGIKGYVTAGYSTTPSIAAIKATAEL